MGKGKQVPLQLKMGVSDKTGHCVIFRKTSLYISGTSFTVSWENVTLKDNPSGKALLYVLK